MRTRAVGVCFHSFFEFSQTFTSVSITQQKQGEHVFHCFRKHHDEKEGNNLLSYFDHQIVIYLFAHCHHYAAYASSVFLLSFSINLLAFYHECRSLIGYATHYLFCDR